MTSIEEAHGAAPAVSRALVALVLVDAALVAAHVWAGLTYERIPLLLNIATDGSLAEIWGYAKWLAAALLFFAAWRRRGNPLLLAAGAGFALILVDDALRLHERTGEALVATGAVPPGLPVTAQDLGELAAFGVLGLLVAAAFLAAWRRRRPGDARQALPVAGAFVALGAVAVVLDALHSSIHLPYPWPQALDLVEDGGEMLIGSFVVSFALALARGSGGGLGERAAAR